MFFFFSCKWNGKHWAASLHLIPSWSLSGFYFFSDLSLPRCLVVWLFSITRTFSVIPQSMFKHFCARMTQNNYYSSDLLLEPQIFIYQLLILDLNYNTSNRNMWSILQVGLHIIPISIIGNDIVLEIQFKTF